jgi:hypothetical protein
MPTLCHRQLRKAAAFELFVKSPSQFSRVSRLLVQVYARPGSYQPLALHAFVRPNEALFGVPVAFLV